MIFSSNICFSVRFILLSPCHSVETMPDVSFNAARRVCQTSVAHFTRVGNPRNPEKTTSFPKPARSAPPIPVAMSRNRENSCSTSVLDFPLTLSVISEAEALEIAQPSPSKLTSRTTSFLQIHVHLHFVATK